MNPVYICWEMLLLVVRGMSMKDWAEIVWVTSAFEISDTKAEKFYFSSLRRGIITSYFGASIEIRLMIEWYQQLSLTADMTVES